MKFLIDNQLSPKLAQWITAQGYDSAHLQDIGLADAPDIEILEFAAANRYVLVSKDEDFLHLSLTRRGRPQLVWVRLGNCRTRYLLSAFGKAMPALVAAITDGQTVVEIR
ncbi:MAG: DUF5615 family PIN-like protein [Phycisphaerae bacterium]